MKRLVLMLSIVVAAAFVFGACNKDATELAWTNESAGAAPINDIIWADGDETWTKGTTGYVDGETTEKKEVSETTGSVKCQFDPGTGFTEATVTIDGNPDPTLSLNEGESNHYTINAATK
jgi:hypothetical protein